MSRRRKSRPSVLEALEERQLLSVGMHPAEFRAQAVQVSARPSRAARIAARRPSLHPPKGGAKWAYPQGTAQANSVAANVVTAPVSPSPVVSPASALVTPLSRPLMSAALLSSKPASNPALPTTPANPALNSSTNAPVPMGFLSTTKLAKEDVAQLKTLVSGFAVSYTSGSDAAKDKAAVDTLNSGLTDLSLTVWARNNIPSKDVLDKFRQAVDGFRTSYTGGKDLEQDKAAWKTLQTSTDEFWKTARGASQPTSTLATKSEAMDDAVTMKVEGSVATPTSLSTVPSTPPAPGVNDLNARMQALPFESLTSLLMLEKAPLSKDDLGRLKGAVDTFAATYTSGLDAAKDKAATESIQTSLGSIMQARRTAHMATISEAGNNITGASAGIALPPIMFRPAPSQVLRTFTTARNSFN